MVKEHMMLGGVLRYFLFNFLTAERLILNTSEIQLSGISMLGPTYLKMH